MHEAVEEFELSHMIPIGRNDLQLLGGTGKKMRHVKIRTRDDIQTEALTSLIKAAFALAKDKL